MLFCLSFSLTAIECLPLSNIVNGMITYSTDTSANYSLDTTATYSCEENHFLNVTGANEVRTCTEGMGAIGKWSESAPVCTGE